jgi:hypothetical protein
MQTQCLILALIGLASFAPCRPADAALQLPAPAVAPPAHPAKAGQAIHWQKSLAAAKAIAARTGKPLFLLHLFGKLDEPFC